MNKTRSFVRFLSLVMAMLMLASAGAVLVSALEDVTYVKAYATNKGIIRTDLPFDSEDDVTAGRIYINGEFKSLKVGTATFHRKDVSVLFQLIKWNKTYEKTMESEPLYEERIEHINDNSTLEIDLGQTCPAGEYLVVFKEAKGQLEIELDGKTDKYGYFTVFCRSLNKVGLGCVYINGIEQLLDMYLEVGFVGEAPAEPFKSTINFQDVNVGTLGTSVTSHYYRFGPAIDVIGQRLNVSAPILGFALGMPTWGNPNCEADLAVFKWQGNYDDTIAADPIYQTHVTGLKDNASNWLMFDDTLPAGEYLFAAMNGWTGNTNSICAVYYRETNYSKGYSYINGAEQRNDLNFTVRFENPLPTGQAPFLDCEGEDDKSDGTVTLPEPWKPAEDSLLNTHKVQPTTWVFTDGLGRDSWEFGENGVGAFNPEKVIGMFYWDWQLRAGNNSQAFNIQQFIEKYPEAKNDPNHSGWDNSKLYYWNEPLYGYYSIDDPWVLRRHAELLANASVDTIFTDNTNNVLTYIDSYHNIFEQWTAAQNLGVNTPKITWYYPIWWKAEGQDYEDIYSSEQIESVYLDVFKRGIYQNMWFWFDGKPVCNGTPMWFEGSEDPIHQEILQFFTFRKGVSSYKDQENRTPAERVGDWGWLSKYPQATYSASRMDISKGKVEQMSVGIAQNHNFVKNALDAMNGAYTMGRSYTIDNPTRYIDSQVNEYSDTTKYGYNFAAQWEYAIETDPTVVYVTGWNEWTVSRLSSWCYTTNAFADQFNDEFSRDIEPTKGALKDHYYYQLINYTRKFKGAEEMPVPSVKATIDLSAGQDQWSAVEPYYAAYIGNTMDRNSYGRVGDKKYIDFSGRNDIIGAKVARDDEFVYFNVECNEDITPYTDKLWMNLYIDVDQTNKGWETFDFVVNKTAASEKTSVLEKFTDGYTSEKVADVEYTVDGKFMTVKIAKSDLGLTGDDFTINFAWTDNVHDADDMGAISSDGWVYSEFSGDIMDFYLTGDVAPGARFKFSYISNEENANKVEDETTDTTEDTTDVVTEDTTEVTTKATTDGDTTAEADGGCKSSVALSVIAVLTALGAAVVLKKRD